MAFCIFIYSYEVTLGLIFLSVLFCAGLIVYRKDLSVLFDKIKRIPRTHVVAACALFFLFSLPMFYMFNEFKKELLPISRLSNIAMNDQYGLQYSLDFFKNHLSPLTSKKFWPAFLTGFTSDQWFLLRHYLIPIAAPFLLIAVINLNQLGLFFLLTAFGVSLFSGNIFPANLFLKYLPVFNSIHNLHFLVQYVLLVFILMVGLGFDTVSKKWSLPLKKSMNGIIISFLCFCVLLGFFVHLFPEFEKHNMLAVGFSIVAGFFLWAAINFVSDRKRDLAVLIIAMVTAIGALLMMNTSVPMIAGWETKNKELLSLRDRTDHSLKFLYERPDIVQTMGINHWDVDLGLAEDSSYLSLKDNSYAQGNYGSGMSRWPYMKSTYLFLLLPGYEALAKKKFLFFERVVNSFEPRDMMAFKRDPGLFKKMVDKSIGMVSGGSTQQANLSLGTFDPQIIEQQPFVSGRAPYSVEVKEYKANSIKMLVNVPRQGLLTYTDAWDKNWHVSIDGREAPLQKIFYTFKGVVLSKGFHEVDFIYKNPIVNLILMMNAVFWLCFCFFIFNSLKIESKLKHTV